MSDPDTLGMRKPSPDAIGIAYNPNAEQYAKVEDGTEDQDDRRQLEPLKAAHDEYVELKAQRVEARRSWRQSAADRPPGRCTESRLPPAAPGLGSGRTLRYASWGAVCRSSLRPEP